MRKNLILFGIIAATINLNAAAINNSIEENINQTTNVSNVKFSVNVTYSGNPLPGASVNIMQEGKSIGSATTNINGYSTF